MQDTEFWVMLKKDPENANTVVAAALGLVKVLAAMVQPYMPATTRLMLGMLNGPWEWVSLGESFEKDVTSLQTALPVGHKLGKPTLLFTKIEESMVADLQARFSGQ
jgi:methionyl-tRNA synthetase